MLTILVALDSQPAAEPGALPEFVILEGMRSELGEAFVEGQPVIQSMAIDPDGSDPHDGIRTRGRVRQKAGYRNLGKSGCEQDLRTHCADVRTLVEGCDEFSQPVRLDGRVVVDESDEVEGLQRFASTTPVARDSQIASPGKTQISHWLDEANPGKFCPDQFHAVVQGSVVHENDFQTVHRPIRVEYRPEALQSHPCAVERENDDAHERNRFVHTRVNLSESRCRPAEVNDWLAFPTMRPDVVRSISSSFKDVLRPVARVFGLAAPAGAWDHLSDGIEQCPRGPESSEPHCCNICHWTGSEFTGLFHCEMAHCPRCNSIARDRFLMLCFLARTPYRQDLRVLETSPRLGQAYRRAMRRSFSYTASDFDLSAHEGDIRLDLQDIDLADESIDVLLTPHVLEHVPDTNRALREMFRILSPGGRMYLQVPLCRGTTAVPSVPEFHADDTPVFFNFGWDLTDALRSVGFDVHVLVTAEFFDLLSDRHRPPEVQGDGFDLVTMWNDVRTEDLEVVADRSISRRLGILPAHQFVTWECAKPTRGQPDA